MDFSDKIKELRSLKRYSLDELSRRSGVSKSMISKIERKEKCPTLEVAAKISEALDTTLSSLLAASSTADIVVTRKQDRSVFLDELTGFRRELLSPQRPNPELEFIENCIPPHSSSPAFPPHRKGVEEYITVTAGVLTARLGPQEVRLEAGDSLFFRASVVHQFCNDGDTECRYFLVIDSYKTKRP